MSETFDAYHKWLAIPPSEQPPNHYRLLGLPLFESDKDVIAAAAVQRMNFVRKFQKGETTTAAERLGQEIRNAWACLINTENKQQYDERLRLQLAASHDSLRQSSPVPELPPAAGHVAEMPAPSTDAHALTANSIAPPAVGSANSAVKSEASLGYEHRGPRPGSFEFDPNASSDEQFVEAGFVPPAAAAGRRNVRRRKKPPGLIIHAVGSFAGLVLGYLILCTFGPQYDFLNLMHGPKSDVSAAKTADTKKEQPVAPSSAARRRAVKLTEQDAPKPGPISDPLKWWGTYNTKNDGVSATRAKVRPRDDENRRFYGPFDTPGEAIAEARRQSQLAQTPPTPPTPDKPAPFDSNVRDRESPKPKPLAIPDETTRARLEALVAKTYKPESAITRKGKAELAQTLLKDARETNDDPDARFVMLQIVGRIAIEAGDCDSVCSAADELGKAYGLDALEIKVKSFEKIGAASQSEGLDWLIAAIDDALDQAVAAKRFDLASRLARLASSSVNRLKAASSAGADSPQGVDRIDLASAYEAVSKALDVLASNLSDGGANSTLGSFYCFERGNWELGLPLLAVADDESLKSVAAKELIGGSRTAGDEKSLADDWWGLGENRSGRIRERARSRSVYWYRRAMPQLSGFAKATAAAHIKEFENARNRQTGLPSPTTAVALEKQARLCPTAEEAYSLYKAFFSDAKVAPEEKTAAEARLAYWENAANKNLIRLGADWVSLDEAQLKRKESRKLVDQAVALAKTNVQSAKALLQRASRVNPEGLNPEFLVAVIEGGTGNLPQSKIAFNACSAQRPSDPGLLNDLAVAEVLLGDCLAPRIIFERRSIFGLREDEVLHNVRKVVAQVDNKNILMSASLLSTYRTLLAHSEGKPLDARDGQMGWLYSIPDADPGDAESVDYGPLAGVGHLRIESASSHLIENRICVLCKGTGKIRCPDCHNGTIATTRRKPAYRNPITGEVHFQDDRAYITCGTCHGSGLVDCPACGGKGGQ